MDEIIDYINNLYNGIHGSADIILDPNCFVQKNFINQLSEVGRRVFQQTAIDNGISDIGVRIIFINDTRINALADYIGDTPLICINIGCIMNLLHYSSLLSIHSGFFDFIGDLRHCADDVSANDYYFPEITEESDGIIDLCFYAAADDQERQSLALTVALLAHAFLVFHELGHHIYGHTRYLKMKYGISRLRSQGNTDMGPIECIAIQCMETHADAFAIRKLAMMFIGDYESVLGNDFLLDSDEDRLRASFEMMITVVSLVYLLMDDDGIDEANFKSVYYLPQRLRVDLILRTLRTIFQENQQSKFACYCLEIADLSNTVAHIYTDLRCKLCTIKGIPDLNVDEKLLYNDEIEDYYHNEMLPYWEKLKIKLAPHSIAREV